MQPYEITYTYNDEPEEREIVWAQDEDEAEHDFGHALNERVIAVELLS